VATEKKPVTTADFAAGLFDLDGATEFKNLLIHGDPGSGKTVLAGTLPGRNLILAGEPGYIAAARQGARGTVRLIPDTATATAAAQWLEDGNAKKFDWVTVDGVSVMNNKFLLGYTAEAFDLNPKSRAHRNLPDKPDYLNAQNFTKSWVARMVDLPVNVLFTAHSMRPTDKEGDTIVVPAIQGKGFDVASYICGLMHVVGYMAIRVNSKGDQVRRVLWQQYYDQENDVRYIAKDQFDALGVYTDDITMPEVIELIDGTEPTKPKRKVKK
jgi:AAA domain-containing protein